MAENTVVNGNQPPETDVQLTGIYKRFGDFLAVDNVSFSIMRGEFFSMLGPSGCGKTTTLRMIAGFETPDEGDIQIAGESVLKQPPYLRKTNMVFQSLALFPHMNVFDNIAYGLEMKKLPKQEISTRVMDALDLVRLGGYEKRRVSQLSGGQRQRIAIARALVNRPRVLLLDEPLGALDLKLRLQLQVELKRIQHELGSTFIYVTHDQSEALTMSDKIAVMNEGRVVQFGSPREIYERPTSRFVANFIGDTNLLEGGLLERDGEGWVMEVAGRRVCAAAAAAAAGEQACLSLRHEKVKLGRTMEGMDNQLPVVVREVVFIGSLVKYYTELESGMQVVVQVVNETQLELFQRGEALSIGWNRADAILLTN